MKRYVWLAGLLLGVPCAAAADEARVAQQMTAQGQENLRTLINRLEHGALGEDIREATVTSSFGGLSREGAVRIELMRADGAATALVLLRPPDYSAGMRPKYFSILPDDDIPPGQVNRLAGVLDEVFAQNPWLPPATPTAGETGSENASRERVFFGFGFLVLSLASCLVLVLGFRPD